MVFPPHPTVLSQRQSTGPPFSGPPVLLDLGTSTLAGAEGQQAPNGQGQLSLDKSSSIGAKGG